ALRAHAERLYVHLRAAGEIGRALEGARERDAGADALLERGGARRVIAAERHAPDPGAGLVDVRARFEEIENGFHRLLVFRAERETVLGLALAGPVEGEGREAARKEAVLVVVHLFLRRIEAHAHDDDGRLRSRAGRLRGLAQIPVELP